MPRPLRYKDGWYCVWRPDGYQSKQKTRYFSFRKHPNPLHACQDWCDIIDGKKVMPQALTLELAIREYLRDCELTGRKRRSTLVGDAKRYGKILAWATANKILTLDGFTIDAVRKFQLYFFSGGTWWVGGQNRKVGNRRSTWLHYLMALSALFKWCVARGYLSANPASSPEFKIRIPRQIPNRIYTKEELNTTLQYIDQRYQHAGHSVFFRLLSYTGCRASEARELTWKCINLTDEVIIFVKTKSGKPRAVPIAKQLLPYLKALPCTTEYVVSPRVTVSRYYNIWTRALKACGFRPGRLHDIRHTFATAIYLETKQLRWAQEMLGHASLSTTEIYTHVTAENLREAIKKVNW